MLLSKLESEFAFFQHDTWYTPHSVDHFNYVFEWAVFKIVCYDLYCWIVFGLCMHLYLCIIWNCIFQTFHDTPKGARISISFSSVVFMHIDFLHSLLCPEALLKDSHSILFDSHWIPNRFLFDYYSIPIRFQLDSHSISMGFPFDFNWIPIRLLFDSQSIPIRLLFHTIQFPAWLHSNPVRFHVNLVSLTNLQHDRVPKISKKARQIFLFFHLLSSLDFFMRTKEVWWIHVHN